MSIIVRPLNIMLGTVFLVAIASTIIQVNALSDEMVSNEEEPDELLSNEVVQFRDEPKTSASVDQDGGKGSEKTIVRMKFTNFEGDVKVLAKPCKPDTRVLIIVLSTPERGAERKAVRRCWAGKKVKGVEVKFLIGSPKTDGGGGRSWEKPSAFGKNKKRIIRNLKKEFRKKKDLIWTNIIDMYGPHVGLKILTGHCWAQKNCKNIKYILKIDEDSVMNIPRLMYFMKKFDGEAAGANNLACWGSTFDAGGTPFRTTANKWYLPWEDYAPVTLPEYMNGPTYMHTIEATKALCENSHKIKLIRLEDVMITGLLRIVCQIKAIDSKPHFNSFGNRLPVEKKCDGKTPHMISMTDTSEKKNFGATCKRFKAVKC